MHYACLYPSCPRPCVMVPTQEEGLRSPPLIHLDSNLSTVKRANSTNAHWGVMALWQSRGVYSPPPRIGAPPPPPERATELAVAVSAEAVKSVLVHGPKLWFVLLGLSKK